MARARRTPAESTPAVTADKLVKLVKSGITSHSAAAEELGVPVSAITSLMFSRALVDGGEYSEIAATSAAVKRARDVEQNRWELIAARTGESVGAVKELYGGDEAASSSTISGRRTSNGATEEAETPKRGRGRPRKAENVAPAAATTGKRATAAATPRRARTRAERRTGRSGNPS
jgi:hypothetical protein